MLSYKVIHKCITTLFAGGWEIDEVRIECIVKLLTVVGKFIDIERGREYVAAYCNRLQDFGSSESPFSTRIRFMCQDICLLYGNDWSR